MPASLLFGCFLILLGLSYIVGALLGVSIPLFRVLLGIFIIYMGFQVITGARKKSMWHCCAQYHGTHESYSTFMGQADINLDDETLRAGTSPCHYATVMGKTFIDLSRVTPEGLRTIKTPVVVEINSVFADTYVRLNKTVPTHIIAKGAFAKIELPDATAITFGTHTHETHKNEKPLLLITASAVFAKIEFQ